MYGSFTSVLEGVAEAEGVGMRTEVSGGGGRYVSAIASFSASGCKRECECKQVRLCVRVCVRA